MNHKEIRAKGLEIEEYIKAMLAEHIEISRMPVDGDFGLGPCGRIVLEIKSAELRNSGGRERERGHAGRFFARKEAHEIMLKGGYDHWYCLALTYKKEVLLTRFIKAKYVKLSGNYIDFSHLYHKKSTGLEKFVGKVRSEMGEGAADIFI